MLLEIYCSISQIILGLGKGLEKALTLLNRTKSRGEGTSCQQILVILSDGSASYERDLFEKYDPNNTVRVFTFVVGPAQHSIPVDDMKEMASKHKGTFLR